MCMTSSNDHWIKFNLNKTGYCDRRCKDKPHWIPLTELAVYKGDIDESKGMDGYSDRNSNRVIRSLGKETHTHTPQNLQRM